MAVIARRTWANLETEHILRVGREGDTAYNARAQQFINSSYFLICRTWHHWELDTIITSLVFSTSDNEMDISSITPVIVFGVEMQDAISAAFIKMVLQKNFRYITDNYSADAAEPKYFGRHADKLYFDKQPDQVYKSRVFYYDVEPPAADFATGSPDISRTWDEPLLTYSVYLAHLAESRPEEAQAHLQTFGQMVEPLPQPLLSHVLQVGRPGRELEDTTHGGAEG